MDRLTPKETHQLLDEWMEEQTSNYQNKENARFQVSKTKISEHREIINILLL